MMTFLWPVLARFFSGVEREDRFISTPKPESNKFLVNVRGFVRFRFVSCEPVGCPPLPLLCICRASVKRLRCVLFRIALSSRLALSLFWRGFTLPPSLCPHCECGCIFVSCTVCVSGLRLRCGVCIRFELEGRSVLSSFGPFARSSSHSWLCQTGERVGWKG